jgi:hypothetical protein
MNNIVNFRNRSPVLITVVAWFLCSFNLAYADDDSWLPELPSTVQIHGFLSQGFVMTSDNNFFGETDNSISTDYRELGINGSWRALPDLQFSLQIVWRNAGLTDDSDVRIDYGLADYSFYSTESSLLGIKAGRVPTPIGFYNDTRDVLSTRPSILLPQSIYFDRNRNLAISADGGYLYGEHRTEYGDFSFSSGVALPRVEDPSLNHAIHGDLPGKMVGDILFANRVMYEWQGGRVRLAITYLDFTMHYSPEPAPVNLGPGQLRFTPWYFSAQYNAENWSLTSEYALRRFRTNSFGVPANDVTGESFYIQGIYHITPYLQALVRYDSLKDDITDGSGEKFAAATGRPRHTRFAQDWTFGLRVEPYPNLLVSGEYHRVNGTAWLSSLENKSGTTQHWDMFVFMISYDF